MYLSHLSLPICPRCNDTKYIKSNCYTSTKLSAFNMAYRCTDCKIEWQTGDKPRPYYEKESADEQIISLNRDDTINDGKPEVLYTEGVTKKKDKKEWKK